MATRHFGMNYTLLTTLTLIGIFIICRYYYGNPLQSVMVASNYKKSTSNLGTVESFSNDGVFYTAADVARRDEDWEKKVCPLKPLSDLNDFYDYIFTRRVPCEFRLMLGGHLYKNTPNIDGDKWVCMDKKFNISARKCLVFSFGIGGDWSFEDDVVTKLGCKVFAFDPTIKQKTHKRSRNISFFNVGISSMNKTSPETKVKVDRYVNILSGLGHLDSIIDILKIDVEGSEYRFFKDVLESTPNLLKKVKMIAMEVHIAGGWTEIGNHQKTLWKYFQLLDCFGFKIWYSSVNPMTGGKVVNGRHRTCCYEIVWIQDRKW